jgi:hypothetical protein
MDRRKMLALLGAAPALMAGTPSFAGNAPKTAAPDPGAASCGSSGSKLSVMNPGIETKLADRVPLAPRLSTLQGKTIYFVDFDWGGMGQNGDILHAMQSWFAQHMPSVKTIYKLKGGNFVTDDPGLWKEIADNHGDAVVIGVAG